MVQFFSKRFSELTNEELYELLRLRSDVFVVEQECVFLDLDNKDQEAIHVLGKKGSKLVAYTRLFDKQQYYEQASIGRVVVNKDERKFGYGHDLMRFSIDEITNRFQTSDIKIGAQTYLQQFYESHGFKQIGANYIEDGIPHMYMMKTKTP